MTALAEGGLWAREVGKRGTPPWWSRSGSESESYGRRRFLWVPEEVGSVLVRVFMELRYLVWESAKSTQMSRSERMAL